MKIIQIIQKHTWGDRVEIFDAKDLKYFCHDVQPHCVSMKFKNHPKEIELDLCEDYEMNLHGFFEWLIQGKDGEIFNFHSDNTQM